MTTATKHKRDWRIATDAEREAWENGWVGGDEGSAGADGIVFQESVDGLLIGVPYPFRELTDEVIEDMPAKVWLTEVSYDDKFTTTEQIDAVLTATTSPWEASAHLDQWESESRYDSVRYNLDELAKDVVQRWLREDHILPDDLVEEWYATIEWEEARQVMEDRDQSDMYGDLASHTGPVYVRVRIGEPFIFDGEVTDDLVADIMGGLTYDTVDEDALEACVRRILPECYHGGEHTPFLFGSVDLGEVWQLGHDPDAKVTLRGGSLLFEECWNGAGYNDRVAPDYSDDNLVVTIPRRDLVSDAGQFGCSWDSVCGFVTGAYPITVEVAE